jgi:hypothetical protein
MREVQISDDGLVDLNEGFWFYEAQEAWANTSRRVSVQILKV